MPKAPHVPLVERGQAIRRGPQATDRKVREPSAWRQSTDALETREISGNPRDACLRFLRRFGVADKRSYREWTTREQQRLIELMDDVPVEEAARVLRRPPASVRSMLHRLASAFARAGNGSRYLFWPKPCTLAVTRCASGLIEAGSSAALFRRRASECKLSTRTISVLSSRTMAVR